MGYRQLRLSLAIEALDHVERLIAHLARSGGRQRVIDEALATRDQLVEEVQEWQARVEREKVGRAHSKEVAHENERQDG